MNNKKIEIISASIFYIVFLLGLIMSSTQKYILFERFSFFIIKCIISVLIVLFYYIGEKNRFKGILYFVFIILIYLSFSSIFNFLFIGLNKDIVVTQKFEIKEKYKSKVHGTKYYIKVNDVSFKINHVIVEEEMYNKILIGDTINLEYHKIKDNIYYINQNDNYNSPL